MEMATKALVAAGFLVLAGSARAGWVSGGGRVKSDAENPWFVQNTETATYCLSISPETFGVPLGVARNKVQKAFDYWLAEFKNTWPIEQNGDKISIGTQKFKEVPCENSPDVTFQFGYLTPKQRAKIAAPQRFGALTVRTDYDEVNLRGKGFVYVSPEAGPLAPLDPSIEKHRWEIRGGRLLELVLIHEVGHIFGIPPRRPFMNADFVDDAIGYSAQLMARTTVNPGFFKLHENQEMGGYSGFGGNAVFGLPPNWKCLKFIYKNQGYDVYGLKEAGVGEYIKLGRIMETGTIAASGAMSRMYLTPRQTVFKGLRGYTWALIFGTSEHRAVGHFNPVGQASPSSVIYESTAEKVRFDGLDSQGNIYPDISPFDLFIDYCDIEPIAN